MIFVRTNTDFNDSVHRPLVNHIAKKQLSQMKADINAQLYISINIIRTKERLMDHMRCVFPEERRPGSM